MYNTKSFLNRFSVFFSVSFLVSFLSLFSFSVFAQNTPSGLPTHVMNTKHAKVEASASVNINSADAQMIANAHIKGIGKKRAQAIVAYRTQHGPFKSVDELKNIKGLSEKIILENKDRLKID